jgi:hypothetical protein
MPSATATFATATGFWSHHARWASEGPHPKLMMPIASAASQGRRGRSRRARMAARYMAADENATHRL